jgi:uncharacterized protein YjbI with pentapeptide repeats
MVDFKESKLEEYNLQGVNLTQANFRKVNLEGADFG